MHSFIYSTFIYLYSINVKLGMLLMSPTGMLQKFNWLHSLLIIIVIVNWYYQGTLLRTKIFRTSHMARSWGRNSWWLQQQFHSIGWQLCKCLTKLLSRFNSSYCNIWVPGLHE